MTFKPDPRRQAVIEEARAWIGTPFRHQAQLRGVGVDCAQLVIAVALARDVAEVPPEQWRRFAGYGRAPNPARMGAALETFMVRIAPSRARPGDVMWLQWREGLPMHLAILAEHNSAGGGRRPTMIHALAPVGKVVEHGFTAEWRARVVSWWRFPGLARRRAPAGPRLDAAEPAR